jgi:hypothetical protein
MISENDPEETETQIIHRQSQSPQPITPKKAIIIGCLSGLSLAIPGILVFSSFTDLPNPFQVLYAPIIALEIFIFYLLEQSGSRLLTIPFMLSTIIIIRVVLCAIIGYLLILIRKKLKWKDEFSIPRFALKIIILSIILPIILIIISFITVKFFYFIYQT